MIIQDAIQVGKKVENIMRLPCVYQCTVTRPEDADPQFYFYLFSNGQNYKAAEGDWICRDADGGWCVMRDQEYKNRRELSKIE